MAEAGDEGRLSQLLQERPEDVGKQDENGQMPLHLAAKGTHPKCCQMLLDVSKGEINIKDKSSSTPLLLCITTNPESCEVAKLLITNGAKVNMANKAKRTALHFAAETGNLGAFDLLLGQTDIKIESGDREEQTPLHLASKGGHWRACQILVAAGAKVTACDIRKQTPLHMAAKLAFSGCCKYLLSETVVNSIDVNGNTALHLLCASGKKKPECAKVLLEGGSSVVLRNKNGETPFHVARHSPFEVKKTFENQPVDLLIQDSSGNTVLHRAAERHSSKHVELILSMAKSRNVDVGHFVNMKNERGMTALHVAIDRGEGESCKVLVKAGSDTSIECESLGTPLSMAADRGLQDICNILSNVQIN